MPLNLKPELIKLLNEIKQALDKAKISLPSGGRRINGSQQGQDIDHLQLMLIMILAYWRKCHPDNAGIRLFKKGETNIVSFLNKLLVEPGEIRPTSDQARLNLNKLVGQGQAQAGVVNKNTDAATYTLADNAWAAISEDSDLLTKIIGYMDHCDAAQSLSSILSPAPPQRQVPFLTVPQQKFLDSIHSKITGTLPNAFPFSKDDQIEYKYERLLAILSLYLKQKFNSSYTKGDIIQATCKWVGVGPQDKKNYSGCCSRLGRFLKTESHASQKLFIYDPNKKVILLSASLFTVLSEQYEQISTLVGELDASHPPETGKKRGSTLPTGKESSKKQRQEEQLSPFNPNNNTTTCAMWRPVGPGRKSTNSEESSKNFTQLN
jgi:hypothetical protein